MSFLGGWDGKGKLGSESAAGGGAPELWAGWVRAELLGPSRRKRREGSFAYGLGGPRVLPPPNPARVKRQRVPGDSPRARSRDTESQSVQDAEAPSSRLPCFSLSGHTPLSFMKIKRGIPLRIFPFPSFSLYNCFPDANEI